MNPITCPCGHDFRLLAPPAGGVARCPYCGRVHPLTPEEIPLAEDGTYPISDSPAATPRPVEPLGESSVLTYATGPDLQEPVQPNSVAVQLLQPWNLTVMFFVFCVHGLGQLLAAGLFIAFGGNLWGPAPYLPMLFVLLAHYGVTIEETGLEMRDDLPRMMRDLSLSEDLLRPFLSMSLGLAICFAPAVAAGWILHHIVPIAWVLPVVGLGLVGCWLLPAVLVTLLTGTSLHNLRPDRVLSVIQLSGRRYIAAALLATITVPIYAFSIVGLTPVLPPLLHPNALWLAPVAVATLAGIYLTHLFCWQLGMLYRANFDQFPWVHQQREPTAPASPAPPPVRRTPKPPPEVRLAELRETERKNRQAQQQQKQPWDRNVGPPGRIL